MWVRWAQHVTARASHCARVGDSAYELDLHATSMARSGDRLTLVGLPARRPGIEEVIGAERDVDIANLEA